MAKFKVGDRVRVLAGHGMEDFGAVDGDMGTVDENNSFCPFVKLDGDRESYRVVAFHEDYLAPLTTPSAIRTVTRREIVPGSYGTVSITQSSCGEFRYFIEPYATAEQLREAARLFNYIAEVLDENSDKPSTLANNWIEWHGGKCPVDGGTIVEIELRSGKVLTPRTASHVFWHHGINDGDITAYRILPCAN